MNTKQPQRDDDFDDDIDNDIEGAADGHDEVLVAYLDGQLSAAECERVESLLSTDAATRQRLQSLDRVWNALDVLPRSTASPTFTRTTIEMAAVTSASKGRLTPEGTRARRRFRFPLWAVATALGLAAGSVLTLAAVTAPQRRALADLPVALHASALEQAGSLEFLTKLAAADNKGLAEFRDESVRSSAAAWADVTAASPPERRDWVEALAPAEQTTVNARAAEYRARPAAKQESLRRFNEELSAAPNAAELRETALAYEAMVRRLSASKQASLRQMTADQRLGVVDHEARRWAHDAKLDLAPAELAAFRNALDRLTSSDSYRQAGERYIDAMRAALTRQGAGQASDWVPRFEKRMRELFERKPKMLLVGVTARMIGHGPFDHGPFDRGRPDQGRSEQGRSEQGRSDQGPRDGERMPGGEELQQLVRDAWRGWVDQLIPSLPADAAEALRSAENDAELANRLNYLLLQTRGEDDLPTAFARLDSAQMDSLLLAPTDEFRDTLAGPEMEAGPLPPEFDFRGGRSRFEGPPGGGGDDRRRGREFGREFGRGGPPREFDGPPPEGPPPPDRL